MLMIGFGHRKSVGKSTAAKFMTGHFRICMKNSNIQHHGFADKLKDICFQLYSWAGLMPGPWYEVGTENYKLKDVILPALGKSPRQIWIEVGTLVGREVYEHTWVDYIQHNVKADICIMLDMRFPNEANRIRALGGYVYKIENPNIVHTPDVADDPLEDYQHWDEIIVNDHGIKEFHDKVITLAERLRLKLAQKP